MTEHMAMLVADEVRQAYPQLNVMVIQSSSGYIVKVRDGCELIMKFGG